MKFDHKKDIPTIKLVKRYFYQNYNNFLVLFLRFITERTVNAFTYIWKKIWEKLSKLNRHK